MWENDEARMTKSEAMTKLEIKNRSVAQISPFSVRHSFVIPVSDFVIF